MYLVSLSLKEISMSRFNIFIFDTDDRRFRLEEINRLITDAATLTRWSRFLL